MSRLIDADALEEGKFHGTENWTPIECASWQWGWNDAIDAIMSNAPTVDPVKHGHWVNKGFEPLRCSVCGITVDAINGIPWAIKSFNYCPHCGAKMDEVEDGKID